MPLYESTFITRHDMSAQQVEGLTGNFTNIIKENGGEVTKTEYWGLRNLAYRIKKNRKGHYVFFNIDAPFETMRELERNLRLNEDVLRYLTVAVDELDPNPSPIMQARAARDERSRRGGGAFPKARGDSAEKAKPKPDSTDEAAAAPAPAKESKIASAPADQPAPAPAKESKAASAPAEQPAPAPAKESKAASVPADQPAPASATKSKAASAPADQPAPAPAKESKAASAPADQPAPASAKKSKAASAPAKKSKAASAPADQPATESGDGE